MKSHTKQFFYIGRHTAIQAVFFIALSFVLITHAAIAADKRTPEVRIFIADSKANSRTFYAYDKSFQGGANIILADPGGDGIPEIITAAGPGGGPHVRLFRSDGSYIGGFFAYDSNYRKGVRIAAGDLDGDGKDEIVTGTEVGGGPLVRVFDGHGDVKFTSGFYAFDKNYHGGIHVAVGDVNGDGKGEIIVGSGQGMSPQVKVFDRLGRQLTQYVFSPFASTEKGGVSVASGNIDGGNDDEIIMGVAAFGEGWIKIYKANTQKTVLGEFRAYDNTFHGGVELGTIDTNKDGIAEILTAPAGSGGPHIRVFRADGSEVTNAFMAYEDDYRGGVSVSSGYFRGDTISNIVTVPHTFTFDKNLVDRPDLAAYEKYIEVDISEQKLYAYEYGKLVKSFLISSGLPGFESPRGEFSVLRKLPVHRYTWFYGPGSKLNYDLPNVKYNLNFFGPFYIHYAYWHNNFGKKKSHGCINVNLENSEWIYNWAPVGTKVTIKE